ncbi:ribonuclease H family protein [Priestia megaterium]|uniref:ribonuclease H n=1 Tax=Priestia megaterium TaxID=1404 RepID=A0A6M6E452_PRIMG|nr:ribonuclease H family protein [Priestia megaterium]QJX79949.1 hypothetical protein FDZ14_28005 [Priestia megaterium]
MDNRPYYVVLMGREPNIYRSWEEVKKQTEGFWGASFKKVDTLQEAQRLFKSREKTSSLNEEIQTKNLSTGLSMLNIYVDGSFHPKHKVYSYGLAVISRGKVIHTEKGIGKNAEAANVLQSRAGELLGSMKAVAYGINNKHERILIYHDNLDIQYLIRGSKEPKNEFEREYVGFMNRLARRIKIDFTKVKAHKDNKYNNLVDGLAKEAMREAVKSLEVKQMKSKKKNKKTKLGNKNNGCLSVNEILRKEVNTCLDILKRNPEIVWGKKKARLMFIDRDLKNDVELTENDRAFVMRMSKIFQREAKKKNTSAKRVNKDQADALKKKLNKNYHLIIKNKGKLRWHCDFLLNMRDILLKGEIPTRHQEQIINEGLNKLKHMKK